MSIEKTEVVDLIEVLENGVVQVRTFTQIFENNEKISDNFHRHVVVPGQDYSSEDVKVQAICKAVQTPEVIAAYQSALISITE